MEKLEKILHAEDAARTAADDARATAARTLSEARAQAVEIVRGGRDEMKAAAVDRTAEIVAGARQDADALSRSAADASRAVLDAARARADAAHAAVLQVLKGR